MDQIKTFARAAFKHLFWVGCGVVLVVSMGSWFMARGKLADEFDKNLQNIKTKSEAVAALEAKPNLPNEHSHKRMDQLLGNTLQLVVEAWNRQYSLQESILTWTDLGPDFVAAVRPLKPIELTIDFPTPPNKELNVDFLRRYRDYVDRMVPDLAEDIGTPWLALKGAPPGAESANMMAPQGVQQAAKAKEPLVLWSQQDQARLLATHFDWSSQPDAAPTTLQMLYAQEDFWVFSALMTIISKTNEGSDDRAEAVVKTIDTILIGRAAIGQAGQIMRPGAPAGGGMGGEMGGASMYASGGMPGMPGMSGMPGGDAPVSAMPTGSGSSSDTAGPAAAMPTPGADGSMGMGGAAAMSRDPGSYRYVDNNYTPLDAAKVRTALKSGGAADAFLVVAKRVPLRMRLIVDQRKLPKLLAECANSRLPVEVRQVRVNRQGGGGGGGGMDYGMPGGASMYAGMGGMSGMGGMGAPGDTPDSGGYGGDMPGVGAMMPGVGGAEMYGAGGYGASGMGMGMGMGAGAAKDRVKLSSTSVHDVPVEIYGIIYIYNPVDKAKLGVEQIPALTEALAPAAAPAVPMS